MVVALAAAYFGLRLVLKYVSTGSFISRITPKPGRRGGLVFAAQGGLVLAIALDNELASESELSAVILSIVAVAVVFGDLIAVGLTRRQLKNAGEVGAPVKRGRTGDRDA